MSFGVENQTKLAEIEAHLSKHSYLSGGSLPGAADAKIFQSLLSVPDKSVYPNFYYWYILIKQFALSAIKSWQLRAEDVERKQTQTQSSITEHYKRSIKRLRSGTRERLAFDITSKRQANLDELANQIQTKEIPGYLQRLFRLDWFRDYKKLPNNTLRVFCMLDEQKTSITDCLTALALNEDIMISPAEQTD